MSSTVAKKDLRKSTIMFADWIDMTTRKFTTLLTGPGVVSWFTRLLANVIRTFGPSKAKPVMNEANISGAFGSSTNMADGTAGCVMFQGTPVGGIWKSCDSGNSWSRCVVRSNV